jgi:hypothetical protein
MLPVFKQVEQTSVTSSNGSSGTWWQWQLERINAVVSACCPASSYMLVWVCVGVNVGAAVAAAALVSFRDLMRGIN